MTSIENDQLRVTINPKGAELISLFHKPHKLEYMWNGDPAFWGKHSPVLFPVVGSLKQNVYYYKDSRYTLPRHGFARDMIFMEELKESGKAVFLLQSTADTKRVFPFEFEFRIQYAIQDARLFVTYLIKNTGKEEMYFSVGGHPAFALPLVPGTAYSDYYLLFEKEENARRWPISKEGLIEKESLPFLEYQRQLFLTKELFAKDAVVCKELLSAYVMLASSKTSHGFRFNFEGFPFLGLWAAKNADFICIEPWCGIADAVDSDQQLVNKEGINKLLPATVYSRNWSIELW